MISLILLMLAGICKSGMDKMAHHHHRSVFYFMSDYWNPEKSWRYKWKNGNNSEGEAFPGSSTVFVWLTDGWHLLQAIALTCIVLAVVFYEPWAPSWLLDAFLYKFAFVMTFEVGYRWVLAK